MFIDCSKLPDPKKPQPDDVYTAPGAVHTVVVTMAPYQCDDGADHLRLVRDGTVICIPDRDFIPLLVSLGLRPWGRLDRGASTRPEITTDPALVAQRLEAFGPHLRKMREQYGLSMGDVARALGCPPARLSMLELAQPDPVREGSGVREDEGRAALAELLAEATRTAMRHAGMPSAEGMMGDHIKGVVWAAIHGMLATELARAAMSTILKARGEASEFRPGDRITFRGKAAIVHDVDHEDRALLVTFESGESSAVPMVDVQLANQNIAVETARAGLGGHLATALQTYIEGGLDNGHTSWGVLRDEAEVREMFAEALATDEAQRLIRLHG